jgi:hypothetical protein
MWVAQFKCGEFSTFFALAGLRTYQHPGVGAAPYHGVGHGYLSPFISPSLHLYHPPPISLLCKQNVREAGLVVLSHLCVLDKRRLEAK